MKFITTALIIPILFLSDIKTGSPNITKTDNYYAPTDNFEDSIQLITKEINSFLKDYAKDNGTYINCSNYGMLWSNHGYPLNLFKTDPIPKYSNTVISDGSIAVIDHYTANGYYAVKFRRHAKTSNEIILKITNKETAIRIYNKILILKDLAKRSVDKDFGSFINQRNGFDDLRKQYKDNVINFLKYRLKSAVDKKENCDQTTIVKSISFYYTVDEKKYWYTTSRFNQPASSLQYGVENIYGFHAFLDENSFSLKDLESMHALNEHVSYNTSYNTSCTSGCIRIGFADKTLYNKNINRYSNGEARQMEKRGYYVTTEGYNTNGCDIYFDNTEPESGRRIIEAFQKLAFLDSGS